MKKRTKKGEVTKFLERASVYTGDDCLIWPYFRNLRGYPRMRFEGKPRYVCQLICEKVHGPAPTVLHQSSHSCGNGKKGCVTPGDPLGYG